MAVASSIPLIRYDLAYHGRVTQIVSATSFIAAGLAGHGDGAFQGYNVYVLKKANNTTTPPHREQVACAIYVSRTGAFTHALFTAPVAVGDEVLMLHPNIATAIAILAALDVPAADAVLNAQMRDVVGNKTDTAIAANDNVSSLVRYAKGLMDAKTRQLFTMDFWSAGLEEAQINGAGITVALPDITVADLPAGATVVRAFVMFKFRMIENTNAGVNNLNGATVALTSQVIQIRSDAPLAYVDAINFVDNFFNLAATTREGGDVIIGTINVAGAAGVDENDIYNLQWLLGRADGDFINFNDVQVGLRIWYRV